MFKKLKGKRTSLASGVSCRGKEEEEVEVFKGFVVRGSVLSRSGEDKHTREKEEGALYITRRGDEGRNKKRKSG